MNHSKPQKTSVAHYQIIAQAIEYIRANARKQPGLAEIAAVVGLSESHLQRVFSEWAGVSPKRFLQYLTKQYALQKLQQSEDVLGVALDSSLSGSGRLHDLLVTCEAMTPGEIKAQGEGLQVGYGMGITPFGAAVIGWTERGICYLAFCDDHANQQQAELMQLWPKARLKRNDLRATNWFTDIFSSEPRSAPLHLLVRGTNFQLKVWEALLKVRSSEAVSYRQLAQLAGSPRAQRAVGTAMAANHISYLIPCHRVIRSDGDVGQYRWGTVRKQAMLTWEVAQSGTELDDHNLNKTAD